MFVRSRATVRNILLIVLIIVILFYFKDSILRHFNDNDSCSRTDFDTLNPGADSSVDDKNSTNRQLMLVQMLFRHGHRSPFMLYPTDTNNEKDWKEGMGMLTQIGRLQHYMLALHLRERYKDFVTTNPKDIEMIHSNNFRCQYAAYSFMAGMYTPTQENSFTGDIPWQPIVSRPANWQGKNTLTRKKCKIADAEAKAFQNGEQATATKEKYKDLYNFWSVHSGRLIDGWSLASDLGKTLASERDYNQSIPEWAFKHWDEFTVQTGITYYFNFGTKLIQKYKVGPLFAYMTEQIQNKILEKTEKKMFVYSAHGSNIACLMLALDQYDWLGPPYASTVVLELWREGGQDYSVRWLYFNSSSPEKHVDPPVVFRLGECGGREFCPLGRFLDLFRWLVPGDMAGECLDPAQKEKFKPFEVTVHVPALSSSSTFVGIPGAVLSVLLLCFFVILQQI